MVDFYRIGCCPCNADVENEEENLLGKQLAAVWIAPSARRISRLIEAVCQNLAGAVSFTWLIPLEVNVIF